jgi:starvation-inducible DNA-binding protein
MEEKGALMYRTRNDLSDNARKASIALLQGRLADAVDLGTQAKQAHWNVKGPQFIALHGLFDTVADAALDWTDTIAERLVSLGGVAEGTAAIAAERSSLPRYPLKASSGPEHIDAMAEAISSFGKLVRGNAAETAEADTNTSDLFTEVSRAADKQLWMVEAHSQAYA